MSYKYNYVERNRRIEKDNENDIIIPRVYSDKRTNVLKRTGLLLPDDVYVVKEVEDYLYVFWRYGTVIFEDNDALITEMIRDCIFDELIPYIQGAYITEEEFLNILADRYHADINVVDKDSLRDRFIGDMFQLLKVAHYIKRLEYQYFIPNLQNILSEYHFYYPIIMDKDYFRNILINAYKCHNDLLVKAKYIEDNLDNPDVNNIIIAEKTIDEWFGSYVNMYGSFEDDYNPQLDFNGVFYNYDPVDRDELIAPVIVDDKLKATESFDLKFNKKYYGLHHVAFPGTYQIDLMFSGTGNNCFLVAIEVNTRYLYVTRTNIEAIRNGVTKEEKKTALAVYLAMEKLFDKGWKPSVIKSDSEAAFCSNFIRDRVYDKRKIVHKTVFRTTKVNGKTAPMHTSLAIVDRVVRTIKKRFANRGHIQGELPAREVYKFVDHYNNKKHKTLSSIFKKPTTPKQVHDDINLEMAVIRNRMMLNEKVKNNVDWKLPKDTVVKVYIDKDSHEKRPRETKLSKYKVLSNIDNVYAIQNLSTGQNELVSRINIARD